MQILFMLGGPVTGIACCLTSSAPAIFSSSPAAAALERRRPASASGPTIASRPSSDTVCAQCVSTTGSGSVDRRDEAELLRRVALGDAATRRMLIDQHEERERRACVWP